MEWLLRPEIWAAFFTLTALEIVLGIDNIIMIAILVGRMPPHLQARTRFCGLALAMVTRILLLLSITWIMRLTADLFQLAGQGISGRDLILFFGGLFLLWKSSSEMYQSLEGEEDGEGGESGPRKLGGGFVVTIIQIAIIDIVFSLDSVITAVGMVSDIPVMVAAIVAAVLVMMLAAGTISDFIDKHPSLKMLALSFLVVVGTVLIAESFDVHVPKGYVYFAMAFSLAVEALNIRARMARARRQAEPVKLHKHPTGD